MLRQLGVDYIGYDVTGRHDLPPPSAAAQTHKRKAEAEAEAETVGEGQGHTHKKRKTGAGASAVSAVPSETGHWCEVRFGTADVLAQGKAAKPKGRRGKAPVPEGHERVLLLVCVAAPCFYFFLPSFCEFCLNLFVFEFIIFICAVM